MKDKAMKGIILAGGSGTVLHPCDLAKDNSCKRMLRIASTSI
jgi:dTDP-glucose pyrophosphorylase